MARPVPSPGHMISISLNGSPADVPAGSSVRDLIVSVGLGERPCAAEVNGTLVPKRDHATRELAPGDRVELVSLVGGG